MKVKRIFIILLLVSFCGSVEAQNGTVNFLKTEKINDHYSVGYESYDEEFEGFGDMWIISNYDTLPISQVEANICHFGDVSPNGKFATFETLSMGWVYPTEDDSILHDRWSGVIVDLSSAKVVKFYRDDYGDTWNAHNLWLQGSKIVFNGNDTIRHFGGTVYYESVGSDVISWITYFDSGEVKETGQSGEVFGCGMNVGRHIYYTREGVRIKSEFYDNWLPDDSEGCHEVIQDIHVLIFSGPFSRLSSRKMYQSSYEGEKVKTGVWQEFGEHEKVISSMDYGLAFDPLMMQSEQVNIWWPEITEIRFSNRSDTLLFKRENNGWESKSVSCVNMKEIQSFISRIELHRLEPFVTNYSKEMFGELKVTASGKTRTYQLMKQSDHNFDVVRFEGQFYKLTKQGLLGSLIAPFVSNLDKWFWESPYLSSGLTQIGEVKFQSDEFESYSSSSEEYVQGFMKLKWKRYVAKPTNSNIGNSLGNLTVAHENGIRSFRLYYKVDQASEESVDVDYFYIETGDDWFIGTYFEFYQFLLYHK